MVSKYLSIEEAATILKMTTSQVSQLRERGNLRGFADRGTWKFKEDDIQEYARSRQADSDSEIPLPPDSPSSLHLADSLTLDQGQSDSDVRLVSDFPIDPDSDSDVALVSSDSTDSDSDVKLVSAVDSDSDVSLADSDSDVRLADESDPGSDLSLANFDSGRSTDSDVAIIDDAESGISIDFDEEDSSSSVFADDESGITLAADSGISLESALDSGISLDSSNELNQTFQLDPDSGLSLQSHEADDEHESEHSLLEGSATSEKSPEATIPMMQQEMDEHDTAFELEGLDDDENSSNDAIYSLEGEGRTGDTAEVMLLEEENDPTNEKTALIDMDESNFEIGDEDSDAEVAEFDDFGDFDEYDEFSDDDDELDMFDDEGDDLFDESFGEGQSQVGFAQRSQAASPATWGTTAHVMVILNSVLMVLCLLISIELVRSLWFANTPYSVDAPLMEMLTGLVTPEN